MGSRVLQYSFLGGEISPAMLGRVDNDLYSSGAQKIENFIVEPQGSLITRPGFQFVCEAKDSTKPVRLIPFRYSSDQTLVLVFGDRWMRIISYGKLITTDDGEIYEIETPYSSDDLFQLNYSQNADIVTIVNNDYPPKELRRYGSTDWRFADVTTAAQIEPPEGGPTLTANYPNETDNRDRDIVTARYVVTAVDENGVESVASEAKSVLCNYYLNGGTVTVAWSSVVGAEYYNVYREVAGIFGFLGQTSSTTITDIGDNPDTTMTPPKYSEPFSGAQGAILSIDVLDGGTGYYSQDQEGSATLPEQVRLGGVQWVAQFADERAPAWGVNTPIDSVAQRGTVAFEVYDGSSKVGSVTIPLKRVAYNIGSVYRPPYGDDREGFYNFVSILWTTSVSADGYTVDLSTIEHTFTNTPTFKITLTSTYTGAGAADAVWGLENPDAGDMNISLATALEDEDFERNYTCYQNLTAQQKDLWSKLYGGEGLSLSDFMLLFPQSTSQEEIPLTITDTTGSGASAVGLATLGVIRAVRMDASGTNYTAPTVTTNNPLGSGAQFRANIVGQQDWQYPSAVTQYDQRRIFAGSNQNPLRVWMTNAGQQDLMMYHLPTLADDRIELEAVTADADRIKHAVALDSLILFTGSSELRVFTQNSDALAPDSVAVRAQSYIGANDCQPIISGSTIVYSANRGGHVRGLSFSYASNGYTSSDLSLTASHLFDGYTIKDLALMKAPYNIVWAVSSTGKLLGMTYYPEHNESAWHQHTTDGVFESICCVSEGEEDRLYAVVGRRVNGTYKRYIERMSKIRYTSDVEARQLDSFVDNQPIQTASLTRSGETELSGLSHLEGKTVIPFVDGTPKPAKIVQNGVITVEGTGSNYAVGLPYSSHLITIPLAAAVQGNLQGTLKNVTEVFLRISYSGDLYANAYPSDKLREIKTNPVELRPQGSLSRMVKVTLDGRWDYQGQIEVEHTNALPVQIQSIAGNVTVERGS